MKKFLLLMLVLGLATTAQAGLIFTVNGEPQPDEITLMPSEIIELDLELSADSVIRGYALDYILSNDQARLIIDGASGSYPDIEYQMTDLEFPADDVFELDGTIPIIEPQHVRISSGQLFGDPVPGPLVLMVEMYVHCLDTTDVILEIVSNGTEVDGITYPAGTLMHTLTIHQIIPEPMTIALLGLGGLFALRKRK